MAFHSYLGQDCGWGTVLVLTVRFVFGYYDGVVFWLTHKVIEVISTNQNGPLNQYQTEYR